MGVLPDVRLQVLLLQRKHTLSRGVLGPVGSGTRAGDGAGPPLKVRTRRVGRGLVWQTDLVWALPLTGSWASVSLFPHL